ncbi:hypothetical protein LSH36_154g01033 [Paralvinella palmiformis]|uniref:Uncharacterized protein n=1 Tax=Paralvinella palmiformis TaxID=53620 RepID=A0AAD9N6W1_9ANNE|nr:hypothetical protein LSH36_154g01033 [Paralvinella palmiformis]
MRTRDKILTDVSRRVVDVVNAVVVVVVITSSTAACCWRLILPAAFLTRTARRTPQNAVAPSPEESSQSRRRSRFGHLACRRFRVDVGPDESRIPGLWCPTARLGRYRDQHRYK